MRIDPKPNPRRGLLAGAVGGLAACFAMSQFHSLFEKEESSAEDKPEDSTVKTASAISQRIFHHELTPQQKTVAGPAVHYSFGLPLRCFMELQSRSYLSCERDGACHSAWRSGWVHT